MTVDAGGQEVSISSPHKVFFPEEGQTKLDLVRYYLAVEEPLMRWIKGRPVLLERYPNGAGESSFFQKRIPANAPAWLQTAVVATPNGTTSNALVAENIAHLVWAVNLGCLGFHVWPYLAADQEHNDELRIDLDPTPGVDFPMIREAAHEVKALLDELGLVGYPKTTGSKGIHIYLRLQPRWDAYEVRAAAVTLARELGRRRPDLLTSKWWKEERGARVFIDYNQNAPHKTVFGAWCARPRVGAQVSMPIEWSAIDTVEPDELTINTVPRLLEANGDAWATMPDHPQDVQPLVDEFHAHIVAGGFDEPWPPVYPKMPHEPPRVAPSRAKKAAAPAKKAATRSAKKAAAEPPPPPRAP
jgi:DNA ligase D